MHGYRQMNVEAGANRYWLTIITYLPPYLFMRYAFLIANFLSKFGLIKQEDSCAGEMETWSFRPLGAIVSDIPHLRGGGADYTLLCFCKGLRLYLQCEAVLERAISKQTLEHSLK